MQTTPEQKISDNFERVTEGINKLTINFARIEGKLDMALELKQDVSALKEKVEREHTLIKEKVETVDDVAKEAKSCAEQVDKRIDRLETSFRWTVAVMAPILASIVLWILNYVFT